MPSASYAVARGFDITEDASYMYGIRHALPLLIKRGSGAIVNTSSSSVWIGEAERVAYQTAKSGLTGLTRHTATLQPTGPLV